MDWSLILSMAIKDIGEQSWKTIHRFWPGKGNRQFWAVANFGELTQLSPDLIEPSIALFSNARDSLSLSP
jgi:hypothetical protein